MGKIPRGIGFRFPIACEGKFFCQKRSATTAAARPGEQSAGGEGEERDDPAWFGRGSVDVEPEGVVFGFPEGDGQSADGAGDVRAQCAGGGAGDQGIDTGAEAGLGGEIKVAELEPVEVEGAEGVEAERVARADRAEVKVEG